MFNGRSVAHPIDPDTQEVFHKVKNITSKENRVIGVITKCDRKQEGAEEWVSLRETSLKLRIVSRNE
jgi:hypothetical protein